jgi:predicted RNase H-like HicB family nuclease
MTNYQVVASREDGVWLADVPAVPGAHTFALSLPALLESIREVIVLMDDLPDDATPEFSLTFDVDDPDVGAAAELGSLRQEITARGHELQRATADTARRLTSAGWSVRDAAVMLHITPGRVSQLTHAHGSARRASA